MRRLISIVGLLLVSACDSGFAEIRCTSDPPDSICAGRPHGSADAWVIAVHNDRLTQRVDLGEVIEIESWGTDSCAAGQVPDNFMPEHRCLWLVAEAVSVCFAGDGEWWTQVDPCITPGLGPAWSESHCAGDAGPIGEHPWDVVACTDAGACTGRSGSDYMLVWPECRVETWTVY